MRRAQRGLLCAAGVIVIGLVTQLPAAAGQEAPKYGTAESLQALVAAHGTEDTLTSGQERAYALVLSQGQFARLAIEAENPGSNLQVSVVGPDGAAISGLSGAVCPFSLYLLAASSGVYRVRVQLLAPDTSPEKYNIELAEVREATTQDRTRVAAGQALVRAYHLSAGPGGSAGPAGFAPEAAQKYQEALSLFRAADDPQGEAEVFDTLSFRAFVAANAQPGPRDYDPAVAYARQAQSLWHGLGDREHEARMLERIADLAGRMGKSVGALQAFSAALLLRHAAGNRWAEANDLTGRADIYNSLGEYQAALNDRLRALAIFRDGSWKIDYEVAVLCDLAELYQEIGEAQKTLNYYDQALELTRNHGDRKLEDSITSVIAGAYAALGDREKALELYKRSVALARGDPGDEAWMLQKLAIFYVEDGSYDKALQYFRQIVPYFRREHRPVFEGASLYWMGVAYHRRSRWPEAIAALQQALAVWPLNNRKRKQMERELAAVYQDSGDSARAFSSYSEAVAESRAAQDVQGEGLALCGLARAERALGRPQDARRDIEAGLELLESVRARIAGEESRSSYFAAVQQGYEFYIDLLMQMHAQNPQQGWAAAALQVSERARARGLLDMLVEARSDIYQGVEPSLLRREQALQQRLRARSEYQMKILSQPHTHVQAEAVSAQLQKLTAEYDETEAEIRARSPRYAALTQPPVLDLAQIQRRVLDPDTLLLEYALGDEHSYVWAVTTSGLASFTLPPRTDIEHAARRVYAFLTARNQHPNGESDAAAEARIERARLAYPGAAARLSYMILGPAAALLKRKRLLIVSDGALHYIPFGALPLPHAAFRPLVIDAEIVSIPSASTLVVVRREVGGRPPAPKAVAVLADPVFDSQDPRVDQRRNRAHIQVAAAADPVHRGPRWQVQRSWSEVRSTERGWQIPRLPFSRREAEIIAAEAPAGTGFKAVDFNASRATATSPELTRYRIVHFATHAVLDSRTPALSGIILSLVDRHGNPQDGFLRLWDIYNLRLPADLVVLSACQTALGKQIRGEGFVGLTRGFMYAGAARVMASLWQVDDVATAELMSHFYTGVLQKHMRPSAALRAAQIRMWKQRRWQRDAYYWAAFEMQGEWN